MKVRFTRYSIPFAIFILLLLTFGLLIPWLGYYQTDWSIFAAARFQGLIKEIPVLQGSPFLNWMQNLPVQILDHQVLIWHSYALLARFLAVLAYWWTFKTLWPQYLAQVTWMAFLFAVIPIFTEQSLAVTYSVYWLAFAAYFLSYGLTILSMRSQKNSWAYTLGAIVATLFSLALIPYLIGLECVRLLILWSLSSGDRPVKSRIWFVSLKWLPYVLTIVIAYLAEIILISGSQDIAISFNNTLSSVIGNLPQFLQEILGGLINILIGSWYNTIEPTKIVLNDRFWVFAFLIGIVTAAITMVYLLRLDAGQSTQENDTRKQSFTSQAFAIGAVALLLGLIPYWLHPNPQTNSIIQNSYAMVAMFGASILTVAIIDFVIVNPARKMLLISILIGMAVAYHIRTANDYRWQWTDQSRFYWQLYWRAPDIQQGTTFLSDSNFFIQSGDNTTTASAISLLYSDAESGANFPINFELLSPDQTAVNLGNSSQEGELIAFTYEPENGNCLWILSSGDIERPQVSKNLRQSLSDTDLSQISNEDPGSSKPPTNLFGREPEHTWCYFYEKAELARQASDYQQVSELGDQIKKNGYEPNNMQEWVTFIDGYARVNRWSDAIKLSNLVYQKQPSFAEWLCSSWKNILVNQEPDAENLSTVEKMLNQYQCENLP